MTEYDWDPEKSVLNHRKHGIAFEAVRRFEWAMSQSYIDDREDYDEIA